MRKLPFIALYPALAALFLGFAAPAHGVGNNCSFQAKGLSISFGVLNPASGNNVTRAVSAATLNANKMGDCAPGQGMTITGDNGLNYSGSRRLKKEGGNDYIRYSLTGFPNNVGGPGNGSYATFTFNGTILASDYANASAGNYSDTVILSVTP